MTYPNVIIMQSYSSDGNQVKWRQLGANKVHTTSLSIFKKIDNTSKEELIGWLLSPNLDERTLASIKLQKK